MDSQQLKRDRKWLITHYIDYRRGHFRRGYPEVTRSPTSGRIGSATNYRKAPNSYIHYIPPPLKKGRCYPGNMRSENEKIQVSTVPGIKCSIAYMRDSSSSCLECPWWVWQLHHQLHSRSSGNKNTQLVIVIASWVKKMVIYLISLSLRLIYLWVS